MTLFYIRCWGGVALFAGERTGRPKVADTLTIPICQTSTYTFKDTAELIAFQVHKLSGSY